MRVLAAVAIVLAALPASATILNGDFELPVNPNGPAESWTDMDSAVGFSHCVPGSCGSPATAGPNSGQGWIWFGGSTNNIQTALLEQSGVTIPVGTPSVDFYFFIGIATGEASLTFSIDGNPLFVADSTDAATYAAYTLVSVPLGAFADGGTHTLTFDFVESTMGTINFNLDDVSLASVQGIPEPGTLASFALGLGAVAVAAIRRS